MSYWDQATSEWWQPTKAYIFFLFRSLASWQRLFHHLCGLIEVFNTWILCEFLGISASTFHSYNIRPHISYKYHIFRTHILVISRWDKKKRFFFGSNKNVLKVISCSAISCFIHNKPHSESLKYTICVSFIFNKTHTGIYNASFCRSDVTFCNDLKMFWRLYLCTHQHNRFLDWEREKEHFDYS